MNSTKQLRIGVKIIGSKLWMGGVIYIELIFKAIKLLPLNERPQIFIVVPQGKVQDLEPHSHLLSLSDGLIFLWNGTIPDDALVHDNCINCCNLDELSGYIDFLFPSPGRRLDELPSAAWIPDFQHIHLPQFFSEVEITSRNQSFQETAANALLVVLSSRDALKDFTKYFNCTVPCSILKFHNIPDEDWYAGDPVFIQKKYNLPDFFIMCSNQFWTHKNHIVIFKALSQLKKEGVIIHCVCTGLKYDYRDENYFPSVEKLILELGVMDNVHVLGVIPRFDQIQLMRRATAIVQPSLFEGWSTVVEDARALGKVIFASDLSVNIEQSANYSIYFKRHDPEDLAFKLKNMLPFLKVGPDLLKERIARMHSNDLVLEYAKTFCNIARKAISLFHSSKVNADHLQNPCPIMSDSLFNSSKEFHETTHTKMCDKDGEIYHVSAIVSTYNSEKFIRGCLEDLINQTLYTKGQLEIIVIDSGSQQNEQTIVEEFQQKYTNIVYQRTERETLYAAWNRGVNLANGKYITNANTDDRHRADALELMANTLDANLDVALVYADVFVTCLPNQTFENHIRSGYHKHADYDPCIMLDGCHMGPQPMWRREVHSKIGLFDGNYCSASDYEFWCRLATQYRMLRIPKFLGLYYSNPDGICNSAIHISHSEADNVVAKYANQLPAPYRTEYKYLEYNGRVEHNRFVNICLVADNRLELTQRAIESVLVHSYFPHVLTVVDNSYQIETQEYLKALKQQGVIKNLVLPDQTVTLAEALELARRQEPDAEYFVKLDNDVVVKKVGWLLDLVVAIHADEQIGAVAYNFEPVSYPVQTIACTALRPKRDGALGGEVVLIPRRTIDKIGTWLPGCNSNAELMADYSTRMAAAGLLSCYLEDEQAVVKQSAENPVVSAIVSTYSSEAFMRECLEDLVNQTIFDQMEVIVVDANSPENERAIVEEYQQRYSNIRYIRTPERITVYAAWNLAIKEARGTYITPFSTNDRLRKDGYEILKNALDRHPDVALVYGDTYLTIYPHETFEKHTCCDTMIWPDYSFTDLLLACLVGPHPMWRRSVHDLIGYFDEKYLAIGDQEFWLRMGERFRLLHINEFTGLYWESDDALSVKEAHEIDEIRIFYQNRHAALLHSLIPPKVSIIIPLFNQVEYTANCLEALFKHTFASLYELILVDNGSTDRTEELFDLLPATARVIRNRENCGFAKACNQGALAAKGKYLLFLNNDTVPLQNWLEPLIRILDTDPEVAAVGSKLLYADNTLQHAGVLVSNQYESCEQLCVGHVYRGDPADYPSANVACYYQVLTAACLAVRKNAFEAVNGFDEQYWNGFEDVDLCFKLGHAGWKLVYEPRSVLYHFESKSGPERYAKAIHNSELLYKRWQGLIRPDVVFQQDGSFVRITGYPREYNRKE